MQSEGGYLLSPQRDDVLQQVKRFLCLCKFPSGDADTQQQMHSSG